LCFHDLNPLCQIDEGHSDRLAKKDTEKGLLKFR
jgi:hypothetical protein